MSELHLRASQMPTAFACPMSAKLDGNKIDRANDACTRGTAFHYAMERVVTGKASPGDACKEAAQLYGSDDDDLLKMVETAAIHVQQYTENADAVHCEHPMSIQVDCLSISGTADVMIKHGDDLHIIDYKTGHVERDYFHQMAAYAYLGKVDFGPINSISCHIYYPTLDRETTYTFTPQSLFDWMERCVAEVAERSDYSIGDHCKFCNHAHKCPAITEATAGAISALSEYRETPLAQWGEMTPEERREVANRLAEVDDRVKIIKGQIDRFEAFKSALIDIDGEVESDTRIYTKRTIEKRLIDPRRGWGVLKKFLKDDSEIAECVTIGKTAAVKKVRESAGRGEKKAREIEFLIALEEGGAIKIKEEQRTHIINKEEAISHE